MGYSKSTSTVRKHWAYLQSFIPKPPQLSWVESSPEAADKLAYKLRECRTIIEKKPEDFPQLKGVLRAYTINVKGVVVTASLGAYTPALVSDGYSLQSVECARTVPEVIQAWINSQPCDGLVISRVLLNETEVAELDAWAKNMGLEMEPKGAGLRFDKGVSS